MKKDLNKISKIILIISIVLSVIILVGSLTLGFTLGGASNEASETTTSASEEKKNETETTSKKSEEDTTKKETTTKKYTSNALDAVIKENPQVVFITNSYDDDGLENVALYCFELNSKDDVESRQATLIYDEDGTLNVSRSYLLEEPLGWKIIEKSGKFQIISTEDGNTCVFDVKVDKNNKITQITQVDGMDMQELANDNYLDDYNYLKSERL